MTTKIPYQLIADETLRDINLAPNSVGSSEIKDNAITEDLYADVSIPASAYKLLSVGTTALANDSVTNIKIGDDAIEARHYSNQSIPAGAYALLSVDTPVIADDAITVDKMGPGSVDTNALIDDAVTRVKLAAGAIGTSEVEDYQITPAKLQKGTQGDILIATAGDGSFARVAKGDENAILAVKDGLPQWTNNVLPTGTLLDFCGVAAPVGWLVANGRTIGSAASSANNKSDSYEDLFKLLWNNFSNTVLAVVGGRGGSADADWAANKAIALPDLRGRTTHGRDSMDSNTAGRIDPSCIQTGASGDSLGASGGECKVTLVEAEIPEHRHFTTVFTAENGETPANTMSANNSINSFGRGGNVNYVLRPPAVQSTEPNTGRTSQYGGGDSHENMSPFFLTTKIIKI
jgi:microcystin-dependent protein